MAQNATAKQYGVRNKRRRYTLNKRSNCRTLHAKLTVLTGKKNGMGRRTQRTVTKPNGGPAAKAVQPVNGRGMLNRNRENGCVANQSKRAA